MMIPVADGGTYVEAILAWWTSLDIIMVLTLLAAREFHGPRCVRWSQNATVSPPFWHEQPNKILLDSGHSARGVGPAARQFCHEVLRLPTDSRRGFAQQRLQQRFNIRQQSQDAALDGAEL
jgi:hypothetical protein